jgi:VCBS repeat-containing protein
MQDGQIRPLQVGDQLQPGDLILAAQNAIVEIGNGARPAAAASPAGLVEPGSDTTDPLQPALDRIVAELNAASGVAAPPAVGDEAEVNSLWPGLRVERVIEVVTPEAHAFDLHGRAALLPVAPEPAPAELTQIEREVMWHSRTEDAAAAHGGHVFAETILSADARVSPISASPHADLSRTEAPAPGHELSMVGQFNPPVTGAGSATFSAQHDVPGRYGLFSVDADGAWTYSLNHSAAPVQALRAGDSVRDEFTVCSADGSRHVVVVSVHGRADSLPVCSYGDAVAAAPAALPVAPDHAHEVAAVGVFAWQLGEADAHHAAVEAALIEMVTGRAGATLDLHDLLPGGLAGHADHPAGSTESERWWLDRGDPIDDREHHSATAYHPDRIGGDAGQPSVLAQLSHPDWLPPDHGGGR